MTKLATSHKKLLTLRRTKSVNWRISWWGAVNGPMIWLLRIVNRASKIFSLPLINMVMGIFLTYMNSDWFDVQVLKLSFYHLNFNIFCTPSCKSCNKIILTGWNSMNSLNEYTSLHCNFLRVIRIQSTSKRRGLYKIQIQNAHLMYEMISQILA